MYLHAFRELLIPAGESSYHVPKIHLLIREPSASAIFRVLMLRKLALNYMYTYRLT